MPLSIINLIAVTLEVFFLRDAHGVLTTADLWIMAGINIVIAAVSIAVFGQLIRQTGSQFLPDCAASRLVVSGVSTIEVSQGQG